MNHKFKIDRFLAKKRGLKVGSTVYVIAGVYKKRSYTIERIDKDGRVTLDKVEVLNSKKKSIKFKIHHSNLKL